MHPPYIREQALRMRADGVGFNQICRDLGLPRGTVAYWFYRKSARSHTSVDADRVRCPRCDRPPRPPDDQSAYAYLLGLYLGDGYLVTTARVPVLRVFCADAWPGLIDECERAMRAVIARSVHKVQKTGCVAVQSYSAHWPCLLPQHGPGKKHNRPIRLVEWQKPIVDEHPGELLRGLRHSDGCRVTNRIRHGDKVYAYPRYHFTNESRDIMSLCQKSLDRLSIPWRMCKANNLSVARREAVARLDGFVGPKW